MPKIHYRSYTPNQLVLFPQRIDENISSDDPVRLLSAMIDSISLARFNKLYKSFGRNAYHPKMMLKVILYAYMNNVYSCRSIEKLLVRDVHFMWLSGNERPDFITINRFRNRMRDEINEIFTHVVLILVEKGFISLDEAYIDGTKIEAKANKYTFVWRKTVERNRSSLLKKLSAMLCQIDESIAQENAMREEPVQELTPSMIEDMVGELKESLVNEPEPSDAETKERHRAKRNLVKEVEKGIEKLREYDMTLQGMGERNSCSKTDHDATFMRMKEDAMNNGQTKPGYNLQITTNRQFITDFGLFQNPGDTLTMIPFLGSFLTRYGRYPEVAVADSGYGSEENYRFMEEHGIEAFVKYNWFHKEQKKGFAPDPFSADGMYYNSEQDYYVCPMGQHMDRIGTKDENTREGYDVSLAVYRAKRCDGCPLKCLCTKAESERTIEVNYRLRDLRRKASQRLKSREGVRHRARRCVEPEAVFGQMKRDMGYRRFRHFGKDKVSMDFAFFATAFNLKKMFNMLRKGWIRWLPEHLYRPEAVILTLYRTQSDRFMYFQERTAA